MLLAVAEGHKAVDLDPSNADAHFALGYYLLTSGNSEDAVRQAQLELQYNPMFSSCFYHEVLGNALYLTKRYRAATTALEEGLARLPDYDGLHQLLAASYAQLGDGDAAHRHSDEYLMLRPEETLRKIAGRLPFKSAHDLEHLIDGLRLAGIPE